MSAERRSTMGDRRGRFAALLLLCATLALTACASSTYAGIPLAAGAAEPELQSLARRAQAGDKQAQLELGIRYEEGRGVPVDRERAERLYRRAASDSGGPLHVYSPPVGKHGRGRVLLVRNPGAQPGLAEAQARLAALANADRGSGPAVPTPGPQSAVGAAFAVEDFFPDQLVDGQCGRPGGSRSVPHPSRPPEVGENEDTPDLDCYAVEPPQWPAPEGESAWFYLWNLRNFLVENRGRLASDSLSSLLQSSGLLRFEENGFALYSIMALAMAKLEGGCAIHVGRLAYVHGVHNAFDDTMWLLNRSPSGIRLSVQCTQPEIARMLARARPVRREVPIPAGEAANRFAIGYFPHSLMDGRCLVQTGATSTIQDLDDLDRPFPRSDPPDLDCYRTSRFAWPAPPGRSTWYYLGNLSGFLGHVQGRVSDRRIEEILESSRILENGNRNSYVFFVIMRILEARNEIGCAMSFARLAYENGVLEANQEENRLLMRYGHANLGICQSPVLRSVLAAHGDGDD